MAEDSQELGDMLGIDGQSDTTGKEEKSGKENELEFLKSKVKDFESSTTNFQANTSGAINELRNAIFSLSSKLDNLNSQDKKSVNAASDAKQTVKEKVDKLVSLGLKPQEIEGVKQIMDAYLGDKVSEIDGLKNQLKQYESQFAGIANTANQTAFFSAINQLSSDPSLNLESSPITFKEWNEEVLQPTLQNPRLAESVKQALANDPFGTMKSLYLQNLGEALISPDKITRRKEAREKADKRKENATSPKGSGTALKTSEPSKASTSITDKVTDALNKKVRL